MTVPRIDAPESWPAGFAPSFTITDDPGRFHAVELAVRAELFDARANGAARDAASFYASWEEGGLLTEPDFAPPQPVWERLARTGRVYYRVHSSSRADRWDDHRVSVEDDDVLTAPAIATFGLELLPHDPVAEERWEAVWDRVGADAGVAALRTRGGIEVLICRHATSPRRPTTPSVLEWVVVVSAAALPQVPHDTVVLRLRFDPPEPLRRRELVGRVPLPVPLDAPAAAAALNAVPAALRPLPRPLRPDELARKGPVWCWQDLAPPPGEIGGTLLLHAITGDLLYAATTDWAGGTVFTPQPTPT